LIAIYSALLEKIAESPSDVLKRRISLPAGEKVWIVLRSALGF
jgi:phytoene/squalene synthetase